MEEIDAFSPSTGQLHRYRLTIYSPEDIVGTDDDSGEKRTFEWSDLQILTLDRRRLCESMAIAFGWIVSKELPAQTRTIHVGDDIPHQGIRFPVYFTLGRNLPELQQELRALLLEQSGPLILMVATERFWTPSTQRIIGRDRKVCFLPLDQSVIIDAAGKWTQSEWAREELQKFRGSAIPNTKDKVEPIKFDTPVGAKWEDVCLDFRDGETLLVSVFGNQHRYSPLTFGLFNARNNRPSVAWEFLRTLASQKDCEIPKHDPRSPSTRQRQLLANHLKEMFGLSAAPFQKTATGLKAAFQMKTDLPFVSEKTKFRS